MKRFTSTRCRSIDVICDATAAVALALLLSACATVEVRTLGERAYQVTESEVVRFATHSVFIDDTGNPVVIGMSRYGEGQIASYGRDGRATWSTTFDCLSVMERSAGTRVVLDGYTTLRVRNRLVIVASGQDGDGALLTFILPFDNRTKDFDTAVCFRRVIYPEYLYNSLKYPFQIALSPDSAIIAVYVPIFTVTDSNTVGYLRVVAIDSSFARASDVIFEAEKFWYREPWYPRLCVDNSGKMFVFSGVNGRRLQISEYDADGRSTGRHAVGDSVVNVHSLEQIQMHVLSDTTMILTHELLNANDVIGIRLSLFNMRSYAFIGSRALVFPFQPTGQKRYGESTGRFQFVMTPSDSARLIVVAEEFRAETRIPVLDDLSTTSGQPYSSGSRLAEHSWPISPESRSAKLFAFTSELNPTWETGLGRPYWQYAEPQAPTYTMKLGGDSAMTLVFRRGDTLQASRVNLANGSVVASDALATMIGTFQVDSRWAGWIGDTSVVVLARTPFAHMLYRLPTK